MNDAARLRDLVDRLVAAGPKAAHVSASECHEIREGVLALLTPDEAAVGRAYQAYLVADLDGDARFTLDRECLRAALRAAMGEA